MLPTNTTQAGNGVINANTAVQLVPTNGGTVAQQLGARGNTEVVNALFDLGDAVPALDLIPAPPGALTRRAAGVLAGSPGFIPGGELPWIRNPVNPIPLEVLRQGRDRIAALRDRFFQRNDVRTAMPVGLPIVSYVFAPGVPTSAVDVAVPPEESRLLNTTRYVLVLILAGTLRANIRRRLAGGGAEETKEPEQLYVFPNPQIWGNVRVEVMYVVADDEVRDVQNVVLDLNVPRFTTYRQLQIWFEQTVGVLGRSPGIEILRVRIYSNQLLINQGVRVYQSNVFRDLPDGHCVFSPIAEFYAEKLDDDALTEGTRKKYLRYFRRAIDYQKKFEEGIPESEIEDAAKHLGVGIIVRDVFQREIRRYNLEESNKLYPKSSRNRNVVKTFVFSFARHNHLEVKNSPIHRQLHFYVDLLEGLEKVKKQLDDDTLVGEELAFFCDSRKKREDELEKFERATTAELTQGRVLEFAGGKLVKKRVREEPIVSKVLTSHKARDVSIDVLQKIVSFCERHDVFRMFRTRPVYTGASDVRQLITTAGAFKISRPWFEVIEEFNKNFLSKTYFYFGRHEKEARVINAAYTVSASLRFKNLAASHVFSGDKQAYELDMKRAYTQFKACGRYYKQFPLRFAFHNYWSGVPLTRSLLDSRHGFFVVGVAELPYSENDVRILEDLGVFAGGVYSLCTPELLLFLDWGVSFLLYEGVYAKHTFDFEFSDAMVETKTDEGIPLYSYWTGMGAMKEESTYVRIACNPISARDFAGTLAADEFWYDYETNTLKVKLPKEKNEMRNWIHVSAYIGAYTRINILKELRKLDHGSVVALKLDSIVCVGDEARDSVLGNSLFREKPTKLNYDSWNEVWYRELGQDFISKESSVEHPELYEEYTELVGQGGSGKTHAVLSDERYLDVTYCTFTNLLCRNKREEYGCDTSTLHKLLGMGTTSLLEDSTSVPPVLLLDEITMIPGSWIAKARDMYPESVIICAGDIEPGTNFCYQTTIEKPEQFDGDASPLCTTLEKCVLFESDYRSKCSQLTALKLLVRQHMLMRMELPQTYEECQHLIRSHRGWYGEEIEMSELAVHFKKGDWVLCGTNAVIDHVTTMLENYGHAPLYRKEKSDVEGKKDRHLAGEILEQEEAGTRKQLAFTVHSVQGITVRQPSKLFLVVKDFFTPQVFYTAISRAQFLSQIVLVNG
jgi:hypothetical protein